MARCHKVASLPCPPPPTHTRGVGGGYILYVYEGGSVEAAHDQQRSGRHCRLSGAMPQLGYM